MRGRGYAAEQAGHRAATGAQTSQARQPHGPGQTAPGPGQSAPALGRIRGRDHHRRADQPMPSPAAPQTKQREITNHAPTTREY